MLAAGAAPGTSTDGFHSLQVLPIVVDTGSFSSEIYVFSPHNPDFASTQIHFRFFPAQGSAHVGALDCGNQTIANNSTVQYTLKTLCPGLAAGSNFGQLEAQELEAANRPFNVFVRVNNPQGQGFAIEGYPPHTFMRGTTWVTGLKRQAAAPGYQTNCFVGALSEQVAFQLKLYSENGTQIGQTRVDDLPARTMKRLLDVFGPNGVSAPAGDYANVRMEVVSVSPGGVVVFCTVQNNTTFDADFRIGKAFNVNVAKAFDVRDGHAYRSRTESVDALGASFTLGPFPDNRNRHAVDFKHPDRVQCSIVGIPNSNGIEMRLIAPDGATVVAGGANVTSFADVYLGAKGTRSAGENGRWFIDVQGNSADSNGKSYSIACRSGSGHGHYELVGRGLSTGTPATSEVMVLLTQKGCLACHAIDSQVIGPSFRAIDDRYDQAAAPALVTSIRQGSVGKWGAVPMPAMAGSVNESDALTMAQWILGGAIP
jgi:cytochrome c551/c552